MAGVEIGPSVRLVQPTLAEIVETNGFGAAYWQAQGWQCEADSLPPDFIMVSAAKHLELVPELTWWHVPRLFVDEPRHALVGSGIFKGAPNGMSTVEIGYGVARRYWNQGYATIAAGLLVAEAFATGEVESVIAHAAVENYASQRVLQKNGFVQIGELYDFQDGLLLRYERRKVSV